MQTTLNMRVREEALCLEHFLTLARRFLEDLEITKLEALATPEATPSPPSARVQPRRAAKSKIPIYDDAPTNKRKRSVEHDYDYTEATSDDSDDEPIRRRRVRLEEADLPYEEPDYSTTEHIAIIPQQLPTSVKRHINSHVKSLNQRINKIVRFIKKASNNSPDSECIFGTRPWICTECEEARFARQKLSLPPLSTDLSFAQGATMEPGACRLLLRQDTEVPENQSFGWRGMEFAVDACDGVLVLML